MWIILAISSALFLGLYDVMKKLSLRDNDVLTVLLLNTVFSTILMLPVIGHDALQGTWGPDSSFTGHLLIFVKAMIVLSSWLLGYFAIKHLPLTIQGPINASRPVLVLLGAVIVFGERLNMMQWTGVTLGLLSLYLISRLGAGEGLSLKHSRWIWMAIGAAVLGAVSGLYDKFLMARYRPLEVQSWYSVYQCLIMTVTIFIIRRRSARARDVRFSWRWAIPMISIFLTVADMAYFYALSMPGSLVAVVSMIRRGSVIVPFIYGVTVLHERNVRAKLADLLLLMISLILLVLGSL